jgi:hypothetical protein
VPTQSEGNAIKERKVKESKENEKESFPPKLEISDDGRKFAQWFNEKMKPESIKPSQSDLDKWGQEYDKLIRIDKKEKKQITDAVTWAREDEFWTKNFLSPLKLRQKNKDGIMYIDVFLEKLKTTKTNSGSKLPAGVTYSQREYDEAVKAMSTRRGMDND